MKKVTSFFIVLSLLFQFTLLNVNAAGNFSCRVLRTGDTTYVCAPDPATTTCTSLEHNDCKSYQPTDCPTGVRQCLAGAPVTTTNASTPLTCNGGKGLDTAIGCVPIFDLNGPSGFMAFIIGWGVGIAGGIAFLLILFSGFQI